MRDGAFLFALNHLLPDVWTKKYWCVTNLGLTLKY